MMDNASALPTSLQPQQQKKTAIQLGKITHTISRRGININRSDQTNFQKLTIKRLVVRKL